MKRVMLSGVLALCFVVGAVSGATLKVPAEYPSIQAGIDAARDGDAVVVSPGVYYETINFGGKNITVTSTDPNDRGIVGYTVINADQDGSAVTFENGETSAAVLTGFTITGGFGTLNRDLEGGNVFWGAGIYCIHASPTITKNVIAGNRGPVVLGNTNDDTRVGYGGGVACIESNAVVTHNVIRNNIGFVAGGFLLYMGRATVSNNLIHDNSAYIGGGVILIGGELINNTIVGNDCNLGPGDGVAGNAYVIFDPQLGNARVVNNIIANAPSGGGLLIAGDWQGGVIACNNLWNNVPGNYGLVDQQTGAVQFDGVYDQTGRNGNLSVDPTFRNAAFGKDYHLALESPCINAGDPGYATVAGDRDIDGDVRVYASRIDVGADEYVGYVKPVAFAGRDRHVLEPLQPVALDGGESFFYDPCGVRTFRWTQVGGPAVILVDPNTQTPTFTPEVFGEYVFELVVADDRYDGQPDRVLVLVAENRPPVANAGADRVWQISAEATLDGTESTDPDLIDPLTYQWRQVEGEPVDLKNADTATPSFVVAGAGQYVFELVVSDDFSPSEPARVRCIAVPVTARAESLDVASGGGYGPFQPDVSGMKVVYAVQTATNLQIVCKDMTTGDLETVVSGSYNIGPKIDGDLIVWFGGIPYAEFSGPVCAGVFVRSGAGAAVRTLRQRSDTASYSHPSVSGNTVVWVQHRGIDRRTPEKWFNTPYDICGADVSDPASPVYFTVAANVGRRDPFPISSPFADFDSVVDLCGDVVVWEGNGNIYAADISDRDNIRIVTVCEHPARQYDPAISGRFVVWTDQRNDAGDIYGADLSDFDNIREFAVAKVPGIQQQATIDGPLVVYADSGLFAGGIKAACLTHKYGVLAIDLDEPLSGVMPALDGTNLVWLANAYGPARGLTLNLSYSIDDGRVANMGTGLRYDYVQHAVTEAADGDQIVLGQGLYEEKVGFLGRAVTIRSTDPNDPAVVAATRLRSAGSTVAFTSYEGAQSTLAGLTITGGREGVYCYNASPTIARCVLTGSAQAGMRLIGQCRPSVTHSRIVANGAVGIEMWGPTEGRAAKQNEATIRNCLIAGNSGPGIHGGKPTIINCTIVENLLEGVDAYIPTVVNSIAYFNNLPNGAQVKGLRGGTVTYSDVQDGGWSGDGNIDADPLFVSPGRWTGDMWTPGDYHLMSQGRRWDDGTRSWVSDEVTSPCIDAGDPASELLDEPLTAPQGGAIVNSRIDMGVYGGTGEASLAPAEP